MMSKLPKPSAEEKTQSAPARFEWKSSLQSHGMIHSLGFFSMGLTILILSAWFLQQLDLLYVHVRSDGFQQLKVLNESMADAQTAFEDAVFVVGEARDAVATAMDNGEIKDLGKSENSLVPLNLYFPELAERLAFRMPKNAGVLFRISNDNSRGYKVIIQSELCTVAALKRPELVDPVRSPYQAFCRFFGFWNAAGKNL